MNTELSQLNPKTWKHKKTKHNSNNKTIYNQISQVTIILMRHLKAIVAIISAITIVYISPLTVKPVYAVPDGPCCGPGDVIKGGACVPQICIVNGIISSGPGMDALCQVATWFDSYQCQAPDPDNNIPGEICDANPQGINGTQGRCQPITPQAVAVIECPGNTNYSCVNTALGYIRTDPGGLVQQVVQLGIWIGSGLAFMQLLWGSFKLTTSQGNPEGIGQGKDIITNAIIGLVFIVLSVTVLQVIGFDILGLGPLGLGTR
jgi:hypothetical protein